MRTKASHVQVLYGEVFRSLWPIWNDGHLAELPLGDQTNNPFHFFEGPTSLPIHLENMRFDRVWSGANMPYGELGHCQLGGRPFWPFLSGQDFCGT